MSSVNIALIWGDDRRSTPRNIFNIIYGNILLLLHAMAHHAIPTKLKFPSKRPLLDGNFIIMRINTRVNPRGKLSFHIVLHCPVIVSHYFVYGPSFDSFHDLCIFWHTILVKIFFIKILCEMGITTSKNTRRISFDNTFATTPELIQKPTDNIMSIDSFEKVPMYFTTR